jgi:predicted nucleic acid-binding protein
MASKPTVLIDLNILPDVLQKREPFYETSAGLLAAVETGQVRGYVAAHSLTTLFYLIQKSNSSSEARARSRTCYKSSKSPRLIKAPLNRH